jgi:hypothetical protein
MTIDDEMFAADMSGLLELARPCPLKKLAIGLLTHKKIDV